MSLSLTGDAPLDTTEAEHLADCETIISAGLASFIEVGEALADVRDRRLYRQTHGTFEDYCADRWSLTDRRARQLMVAAETGTMVPVTNERQARALAPLRDDLEALTSAWQAANEAAEAKGKPVTAADVAAAVKAQQPEPEPTPIDDEEWEPGGWLPDAPASDPEPVPSPSGSGSPDITRPPAPAETEEERSERVIAEAVERHARRLVQVAQHWHAIEGLRTYPHRDRVLAQLCEPDRQILARIEELLP